MLFLSATALTLLAISARNVARASSNLEVRASDPCAKIANKTWVAPADVRACYKSFPVNATIKANVGLNLFFLVLCIPTDRIIL